MDMDDQVTKILLVEDNPNDAFLFQMMLGRAGSQSFIIESVISLSDGLARLSRGGIDLVLLDLGLPDSSGLDTFLRAQAQAPDVAFVVLTGLEDEALALTTVQQGAQDYLIKGQVDAGLLGRVVRHALERKRAEAALQGSEKRYRLIVETANESIWVIDSENRIIFLNRRMTEMFGYAREELIGQPISMVLEGEWLAKAQSAIFGSLQKGVAQQLDLRFRRQDGSALWGLVSASPILDNEGRYGGALGMIGDITRRRQAEEALKEKERFLSSVFSSIQDSLYVTDEDMNLVQVNPVMEHDFAHRMPLVGKKCYDVFQGRTEPCEVCPALQARETGKAANAVIPHIDAHGNVRWLEHFKFPLIDNVSGKVTGIIGHSRDITARRQAEAEVWEARDKLTTLIQASPLAIMSTDVEGRLTSWNAAAARIFGWREEEVLGSLPPMVPEEKLDDFFAMHRRLIDDRQGDLGIEVVARQKDGSLLNCKAFTAPLSNASGGIVGAEAILEDITAHKRTEEALRQKEELLRQAQKMEAVGRLAGGVAHDFNNILTAITGFTELLLPNLAGQPGLAQDVEEIKQAADRAAALTGQLLAFSRKQIVEPRVLDLNEVVGNLQKMLRRLLSEDIQLTTRLDPGAGRILMDRGQLEQVIINLVSNSGDAMPRGGQLTIATANAVVNEDLAREHPGVPPGDYALLTVSDSGMGIDEDAKAHIFEPFFTTKGPGKGTGLGLATVHGVVQHSGGHISVHSEPGVATTFKIYLPRTERREEVAEVPRIQTAPAAGQETILLVEDEEVVRRVIRRLLESRGYTVLEAGGGEAALAEIAKFPSPIHLLLADLVMPGMSGKELAEQLTARYPGLKVLCMSGHTEDAIAEHGALKPRLAFIQKPFRQEALLSKVQEVLHAPQGK